MQKTNQTSFRVEKVIRRKGDKRYVKWKGCVVIRLIVRLIKKMLLYEIGQYFPKTYKRFGKNVKVKLDLFNYATKSDLNGTTGVDTSN